MRRHIILATCLLTVALTSYAQHVTGRVTDETDGKPLVGVGVSNGVSVTVTDAAGRYAIDDDAKTGYVFVSTPSGYVAPCSGSRPQFYQYTDTASTALQTKDFKLRPVADSTHVIIFQADQHLADRQGDLKQFKERVVPDFNSMVARYSNQGVPVYSISLGDTSWDNYWYDHKFDIGNALKYMDMLQCPVYLAIGNHDNDPYETDDLKASATFCAKAMPRYYSFNAGGIHYIVMDNIVYRNTGGRQGKKGKRDYDHAVDPVQMAWLRADLDLVADKKTPIVISAHAPFYNTPNLEEDGTITVKGYIDNIAEFEDALKPFENVTLFAGHVHRNAHYLTPSGMYQHTLPSLCGTFWWTASEGYTPYHVSPDGSPAGFGIMEVNGRDMDFRYRGLGMPDDYQFRVYDLNEVCIDGQYLKRREDIDRLDKVAGDFNKRNDNNEILINAFAYGPGWTVEAWEGETPLELTRITTNDPLFILCYAVERINHTTKGLPSMPVRKVNHIFKARTSAPDTPVTVRVTDSRGRVSQQTIKRPFPFPD